MTHICLLGKPGVGRTHITHTKTQRDSSKCSNRMLWSPRRLWYQREGRGYHFMLQTGKKKTPSFPLFCLIHHFASVSIGIMRCHELEKPAFKTNGWLRTQIKRDFTNYFFCIYSRSGSTYLHLRGKVYNSCVYKRSDAEDHYPTHLLWLHPPIQQQLDTDRAGFLPGQAESVRCTDWCYLPSSRWWQDDIQHDRCSRGVLDRLPYTVCNFPKTTTSNTCWR